jgi:hypothetical protein
MAIYHRRRIAIGVVQDQRPPIKEHAIYGLTGHTRYTYADHSQP